MANASKKFIEEVQGKIDALTKKMGEDRVLGAITEDNVELCSLLVQEVLENVPSGKRMGLIGGMNEVFVLLSAVKTAAREGRIKPVKK